MTSRLCASCQQEKSIRGVWYITPQLALTGSPFLCESCYRGKGGAGAIAPLRTASSLG